MIWVDDFTEYWKFVDFDSVENFAQDSTSFQHVRSFEVHINCLVILIKMVTKSVVLQNHAGHRSVQRGHSSFHLVERAALWSICCDYNTIQVVFYEMCDGHFNGFAETRIFIGTSIGEQNENWLW